MSSGFAAKKLLLLGFVAIILIAIPVSVYILQQQQRTKSFAAASTNLFFNPSSQNITALDQTANFAIMVDPTEGDPPNQISFAKLVIKYDPAVLSIDETGFTLNENAFSTVLDGPIFSPGSIVVTLSVGADPSKAIQAQTKIADLSFIVLAETDSSPITFAAGTQVLSVSSGDEAGENVLIQERLTPATVTVTLAGSQTPKPTTGPINPNITCTELTLDRSSTGNAPYAITFTGAGTTTDGTLTKAAFNFGDGSVENVTEGGGLGTNSARVQKAYTYNNAGTYTATVIFTDGNNAVNTIVDNCKQTITVNASVGGRPETSPTPSGTDSAQITPEPGLTGTPEEPTPTLIESPEPTQEPQPTIEPTGPSDNLIGIGIAGLILSIIGGILFFVL